MSQFSEDKHIEAIFAEIGEGSRVLCDIGARYEGSNSAALIGRGFTGVLADASEHSANELRKYFPDMTVLHKTVTPEEINEICPGDTWFLSIDIDSFDWWIWANLQRRPALVVVESNPLAGMFVAKRNCVGKDREGYGASVEGFKWLAEMKQYDYLGRTEANCFFVRRELNCKYRLPDPPPPHKGVLCGRGNNIFP